MTPTQNPKVIRYVADVAQSLVDAGLHERDIGFGSVYILKITFGFEGEEDTSWHIQPDEFGGLGVVCE